ncbi:hypothetical protein CVT25_002345 [Psilocybe cyanescens]|uniref:MPN domain-containing protein n=1 Tax=Psilocybe cyanescens TaxID=93625 RepID=A0A409WKJ1_PSICY|nr:hypothetical protein CVT25_002345 [Psilocybe cyanescens]
MSNTAAAHAGSARHNSRTAVTPRRPASIAELAERAKVDVWDDSREFKHHLRAAEKYRREGKECAKKGDLETAFVQLARAATLVLEKLPSHRDYNTVLNVNQRHNLGLNGQDILDHLSELKPSLVDRYEKWLQRHPDGDHERTPNARTQKMVNDEARAQAQREQFQEEERARQRDREQKEQQRLAAEEAAKWKWQREQQYAQDEAEKAKRKEAAQAAARRAAANTPRAPPDYTFSRTPNQNQNQGYGSQNTVVLADGRPSDEIARQAQQEQMRLREEEIKQKRKQEQEGIIRRQRESEEAARIARQNLAPPPLATPASSATSTSVSPMFPNNYAQSSAATTPQSGYFNQNPPGSSHIEYPTIRQNGYPEPPSRHVHRMPLQSPVYEGDSTDSESLHSTTRTVEFKTPIRNIRSPSYPPPITTTSPVPGIAPIQYPSLMSQHQKDQGYFPSLNSMFDAVDKHHGSGSILFGSNNNNNALYPPSVKPGYPQPQQNNGGYPQAHPPGQGGGIPPQIAPPTQAEVARMPIPPNAVFDPNIPLKTVSLPRDCLPKFLAIAKVNTERNKETCGLLLGKDKGHKYAVTTLLIPKQTSTSDTCTMDEEELVLQFTEERSLITLGWIHTHPSQSCFMSSVDLHTHSGFQRMLPESFAVVCAPKSNPNFGIFRLTDPPGLDIILSCKAKEAFHPHPDEPIYTDADKGHVQMKDSSLEIVDLR